jgi:hypothetical protein
MSDKVSLEQFLNSAAFFEKAIFIKTVPRVPRDTRLLLTLHLQTLIIFFLI